MSRIGKTDQYYLIQRTFTNPAMSKLWDIGPTFLRALDNGFTDLVDYYLPFHIENLEPGSLDLIMKKIKENQLN